MWLPAARKGPDRAQTVPSPVANMLQSHFAASPLGRGGGANPRCLSFLTQHQPRFHQFSPHFSFITPKLGPDAGNSHEAQSPWLGGCDRARERDLGRIWPRIISSSCSCLCYLQSDTAAGWGHGRCSGERLGQLLRPQNSSVPAVIPGRKEKRGKKLISITGEQPAPSRRRDGGTWGGPCPQGEHPRWASVPPSPASQEGSQLLGGVPLPVCPH